MLRIAVRSLSLIMLLLLIPLGFTVSSLARQPKDRQDAQKDGRGMRTRRYLLLLLTVLLPIFDAPPVWAQSPQPYSYTSINGTVLTLYPYPGRNIALLVPSPTLDRPTLTTIVDVFDQVYDYYRQTTGRDPSLYFNYNGLATIAVVPSTCGYGCGFLGATGIEIVNAGFDLLYNAVRSNNQYDQTIFYEFGRNFWFYGDRIEYKAPNDTGAVTTGYAVFMRFMAMEATGVTGGPFNGYDFLCFKSEVQRLLDRYLADPSLTWSNTLAIGRAPANPIGLGATDLFAAFLFELRQLFGQGFIDRIWKEVGQRPRATTTQDAVDNFILAASAASGRNLTSLFSDIWRWPVSSRARSEASSRFGPPFIDCGTPIR